MAMKMEVDAAIIDQEIQNAVIRGNLNDVKTLIEGGAENSENYDVKLIHLAAQFGHKEIVAFLLNKGVNVNEDDNAGWTPLHFAASEGQLEVVQFLIDKGANVRAKSSTGEQPIYVAVKHDHKSVVKLFLNKGLNIDEFKDKYVTRLHYAAHKGHIEVVKFLLDTRNKKSDRRLEYELSSFRHFDAHHGHIYFVNDRDFDRNTPLHMAAENGHLNVVEYLIENRASVNAKNIKGEKPVHIAAKNGHTNVVKFFLGKNVNIEETGEDNWTLLHYATDNKHLDLMKYLVDKGANIKCKNEDGNSPLLMAIKHNPTNDVDKHINREIVDFLIDKNGGINDPNEDGWVPLHYAARAETIRDSGDIVEKLVNAGARSDVQNCDGKTPLHFAAQYGCLNVLKKMMETNPNLNIQDNEGRTPFHLACITDNTEIIIFLLEAGARSDIKDGYGRTALFYYIYHYRQQNFDGAQEIFKRIDNYTDIDDKEKKTAAHVVVKGVGDTKFVKLVLQLQKNLNVEDILGNTPLNYLTDRLCDSGIDECAKLIMLFINNGVHLKVNDCERIIAIPEARNIILTDIKLCTQSIANKFNYKDLPALYRLLGEPNNTLPSIENMKLSSNQEKMIEKAVESEIECKEYCDVSKIVPTSLKILCVESHIFHQHSAIRQQT